MNNVSKIRKFISKTHTLAETMVDDMGNKMETIEEILGLLMSTHFSSSITTHVDISQDRRIATEKAPKIDESMVKEAIKSFQPFKAAGPDMVFPALLQKEVDLISSNLAGIFKFAYTHKAWQESRAVFIPKPGKASYAIPKSYRPISLTGPLQ